MLVSANDKPYKPKYEYECSGGNHTVASDQPVAKCPQGGCTGTLRPLGAKR